MQPIYRSDGKVEAVVHKGHIYNVDGEWFGFLRSAEVYNFRGDYMGYLSQDQRLLRDRRPPKRPALAPPETWPDRLDGIPTHFPLAPLFKQLAFSTIDLFEEFPEKFSFISDLRPDME